MRYALLVLIPMLAACGFDCSFDDLVVTGASRTSHTPGLAPDTLHVVLDVRRFQDYVDFQIEDAARQPTLSPSGDVDLELDLAFEGYDANQASLTTTATGDTIVVSLDYAFVVDLPSCPTREGVIQPVCSPPLTRALVRARSLRAPESVRDVRYFIRETDGAPTPVGPFQERYFGDTPGTVRL